jgi:hypothetical protein
MMPSSPSLGRIAILALWLVCACTPHSKPVLEGASVELKRSASAYHEAKRVAVENLLNSGVPRDAIESVDALRLAEGMIALSSWILQSDPSFPSFSLVGSGFTRTGLFNPDNDHWLARIRGDATYRISGRRGDVADFSVQTFRTFIGSSQGVDEITDSELGFDANGGFELYVGADPQGGGWLRSDPDTHWVLVRSTHDDWRERSGELLIERVDVGRPEQAEIVGPEVLRGRIEEARENLLVSSSFWPQLSKGVLAELPANVAGPPRQGGGNLEKQWTSISLVDLSESEALVVSLRPSLAAYQGVQAGSVLFDHFDYENRQTSLSRSQSHVGSDGLLRFVVSAKDPGIPNWIDLAGHRRALLLFRWQGLAVLQEEEFPIAERLPLADVLEAFPPDVPRVLPRERGATLEHRRRQLRLRLQSARAENP